jgi:hypothetical protein
MNDFTSHSHGLESSGTSIGNSTMSYSLVFRAGDKEVAVKPDGTVVFSEGLTLDEAASAFWNGVKSMGIDVRKQALQDALELCARSELINGDTVDKMMKILQGHPKPTNKQLTLALLDGAIAQSDKIKTGIKHLMDTTCK